MQARAANSVHEQREAAELADGRVEISAKG